MELKPHSLCKEDLWVSPCYGGDECFHRERGTVQEEKNGALIFK